MLALVDKRQASDVLLSIERDVKLLLRQSAEHDINIKRILNKLNMSRASFDQMRQPVPQPPSDEYNFPPAEPSATNPVLVQPVAQAAPAEPGRKSIVQQKILYGDSRPVILASVTIADAEVNTNIITKMKTDAHGKWHASLYAGDYIITVIKGPTAAKQPFKEEYRITVPPGGKPLELERKRVL